MSNLSIEDARKRIAELEEENEQLRRQNKALKNENIKLEHLNECYYQCLQGIADALTLK